MTEEIIESNSYEETFELGRRLGEKAEKRQIFALCGDLGCGKTVFAQGFARGLGIEENVNSPTFTIVQIYEEGRLPLYHFDVYRLEDSDELEEIGYEEYFYGDGVCLVEWAGIVEDIMPEDSVWVTIEKNPDRGFDYRRLVVRRNENTRD